MRFNANQNFAQQMRQNDQRFQRIAQQNAKRQQDQFNATAGRWRREEQQRAQEQQQRQFQLHHDIRVRQSRPASLVNAAPGWGAPARPQPSPGRGASCRRCGASLRPGLLASAGCSAAPGRSPGRTLWAVILTVLVLLIAVLAIAAAVHAPSPSPHRTSHAAAAGHSPSHMPVRLAAAAASFTTARNGGISTEAPKETVS